ncbi:MAG: GAF domain-containing protein [Desulfobacteraceae bacterium]|nr:GAF domain-containing protein [Desulfobacteraceae bacterium]
MGKSKKTNSSFSIKDADKRLQVLFEISNAVNSTTNLDELYKVIHKSLEKILKVDNLYICKYDIKKDVMVLPYYIDTKDKNPELISNFSKTPSLTRKVIETKKPIIFYREDLEKEEVIGITPKIWLGSPLIVKNRVIGAIVVQDYISEDVYKKEDLYILNSVSQHIALAIERKENDDTLKEQGEVLEKILESSPVGIALVENRTFKWVNNEIVKIYGYKSKKDFENKSVEMIYPSKEDYKKAGEIIKSECSKNGKADFEYNHVRKDKTIFPAHIILNSADRKDPLSWTIASIKDLSEQKVAEQEKIEREKFQGVLEMAGAVCHELSQPLQSILGYSELLIMESNDDDMTNFNKSLDTIIEQTTRIGKITKKLSGITKYKTIDYAGDTKIFDIWEAEKNS